jgi:hypothetical protein
VSAAHGVEAGRVASLETYVRLALALGLKPKLILGDQRRHRTRDYATTASVKMGDDTDRDPWRDR